MKNLTLNDSTQRELLSHLQITEDLLAKVATKLSGCKKTASITAMPDLGIAHNVTRMKGGFFTGACYSWDSDVPFIPIDTTVNVCGTAVFRLSKEISIDDFLFRVDNVLENDLSYAWNYTNGNHFISLVKSNGEYGFEASYYMIVHASANEFKNLLYPNNGVWYEKDIQIEYHKNSARYLRYIVGDSAIRFYNIAKDLIQFNTERNRYFVKSVLGSEFLGEEIVSIQHYGMPNENTVCIGAHWEPTMYTLLTAPGRPIYLVQPDTSTFAGSPHGFGLSLANPKVTFGSDSIMIGEKVFTSGSIEIGTDAINRCSSTDVNEHVSQVLNVCPGNIVGKLQQIVSVSKDGTNIWQ